ncbi:Wall-associated receptor kinase 2, partial [Mucuna pruriens]
MALVTKQRILELILVFLILAKASCDTKPGCPQNCGSLSIPYPFGTREGCYLDDSFFINCTRNSTAPNSPIIPFLRRGTVTVLNISLDGELVISFPVVSDCYSSNGSALSNNNFTDYWRLNLTHFYISTKNKFTAIGCDTYGYLWGYVPHKEISTTIVGCGSFCSSVDDIKTNDGSCSGIGCCQSFIPNGMSGFKIGTLSVNNHSTVHAFNPCGYAFVSHETYKISTVDLKNFTNGTTGVVLDWSVGNQTCEEAKRNVTGYACKANNSECYNSTNGLGYRCKCHSGFQGNPYLYNGCTDVNECNMEPSPCSKICQNSPGSFKCSCPKNFEGDGMINGTGCHRKGKYNDNLILTIALSVSLSMLALLVGGLYLYSQFRKRKLIKVRERYFRQNGGLLLQKQIAKHDGSGERATIFTAQELKKATNNYDEVRIIGKGGHGTVYKGILLDGRVVAVKKSKISGQIEIEQFINEMTVLSQINHRNVVKLLGCCLETEVPTLVYEFITNGTLLDHIQVSQLSWPIRLRIATETAEALAYLHSAASPPIIHRDVKTANILLDDNLTAKVSDFGASKLVAIDQTHLTTLVQGTMGYLDPEYFQSSQLTEKSDVYSFGVVLAELLTSMNAVSFIRPEKQRNLSMYFVSSMKEGHLPHILDKNIVNDANVEQIIEVANLAK